MNIQTAWLCSRLATQLHERFSPNASGAGAAGLEQLLHISWPLSARLARIQRALAYSQRDLKKLSYNKSIGLPIFRKTFYQTVQRPSATYNLRFLDQWSDVKSYSVHRYPRYTLSPQVVWDWQRLQDFWPYIVKQIPKKGLGLIVARTISKGNRIISEKSIFAVSGIG